MQRVSYIILLILMVVAMMPNPVLAQQPCASPSWEAKFYNSPDFSGAPLATSCDRTIEFSWGVSAPNSGIAFDNFSVRWTSTQNFPAAGIYQFTVTAEDGVRFYVNGTPLINSMNDTEGSRALTANYTVNTAGSTAFLTLESVNYTGNAEIKLVWSLTSGFPSANSAPNNQQTAATTNNTAAVPNTTTTTGGFQAEGAGQPGVTNNTAQQPTTAQTTFQAVVPFGQSPTGGGSPWAVEYFNNRDRQGAPVVSSAPADGINQDYDLNAPFDGIPTDNWSSRWTRSVTFPAGIYTFSISADDIVSVKINGVEIFNQTTFTGNEIQTVQVQLPEGNQLITVEHVEVEGGANLFLTWEPQVGTTLFSDGCNSVLAGKFGFPTACQATAAINTGTTTTTGVTLPAVVRAGPLYFRPQPSKSAVPLRTISRGESYTAVGRSADLVWVQLVVDGVTGWSMTQYLTLQGDINSLSVTDGSQPTTATNTTTNPVALPETGADTTTTTITTEEENTAASPASTGIQARALGNMRLRDFPNDNGSRVGNVDWGEIVEVLGRSPDGKWLLIRSSDAQGWTSREWYEILGDFNSVPVVR